MELADSGRYNEDAASDYLLLVHLKNAGSSWMHFDCLKTQTGFEQVLPRYLGPPPLHLVLYTDSLAEAGLVAT